MLLLIAPLNQGAQGAGEVGGDGGFNGEILALAGMGVLLLKKLGASAGKAGQSSCGPGPGQVRGLWRFRGLRHHPGGPGGQISGKIIDWV